MHWTQVANEPEALEPANSLGSLQYNSQKIYYRLSSNTRQLRFLTNNSHRQLSSILKTTGGSKFNKDNSVLGL